MRKVQLLFFTVGIFFSLGSFSQSVTPAILNATGGTYPPTYYRFEWSFGEAMAIETMLSPNLIVTNGVLQPGTDKPASIDNSGGWGGDEIRILPNPTQSVLEIDFFSKQQGKVSMKLYDASGRYLAIREFDYFGVGRIEKWDLSRYPSGEYFLYIRLEATGTSVGKKGGFKVIKIR